MSSAPIEVCPIHGIKFTLYCPECKEENELEIQHKNNVKSFDGWEHTCELISSIGYDDFN